MNKSKHSYSPPLLFECEICKLQFMKYKTLKEHKRIHSNETIYYKCKICFSKFYRLHDLEQHKQIHVPNHKDIQLNQHKIPHLNEQQEEIKMCNICNSVFDLAIDLEQHKLIHLEETPCKCKFCDKSFTFVGELREHRRKNHYDTIPKRKQSSKCDICDEKFKNNLLLKEHKLIHGENPYNCEICKSTFSRLSTSINHKCIPASIPAKQSEELIDQCFKVVIKEEMPLDIYGEID